MNNKPIQENDKYRKILNNERKFLWAPHANVSVVARILGDLSKESLRMALNKTQKVHPLLSARVVIDEDNVAWFNTINVPKIPLKIVTRISNYQFLKIIQEEHKIPFDIHQGPLIRFILIYSKDISELIAFCLHTICDATALANLLRDILLFVENPKMEMDIIEPPQLLSDKLPVNVKEGKFQRYFKNLIFNIINKKWKKDPIIIEDEEVFYKLRQAFWEKFVYDVVLFELNKRETKQLSDKCREKGITVNSALVVALNAAYQEVVGRFGKNQKRVVIPYDLRTRLNRQVKDSFCLFVGSINIKFNYNFNDSFWKNAQRFHEVAIEKFNSFKVFSSAFKLEQLHTSLIEAFMTFSVLNELSSIEDPKLKQFAKLAKNKKNIAVKIANKFKTDLPGTVITNLGRLEFPEKFGDLTLDNMYFISGASNSIPIVISALGASGKLTLALNLLNDKNEIDARLKTMEKVKQKALKYLELTT